MYTYTIWLIYLENLNNHSKVKLINKEYTDLYNRIPYLYNKPSKLTCNNNSIFIYETFFENKDIYDNLLDISSNNIISITKLESIISREWNRIISNLLTSYYLYNKNTTKLQVLCKGFFISIYQESTTDNNIDFEEVYNNDQFQQLMQQALEKTKASLHFDYRSNIHSIMSGYDFDNQEYLNDFLYKIKKTFNISVYEEQMVYFTILTVYNFNYENISFSSYLRSQLSGTINKYKKIFIPYQLIFKIVPVQYWNIIKDKCYDISNWYKQILFLESNYSTHYHTISTSVLFKYFYISKNLLTLGSVLLLNCNNYLLINKLINNLLSFYNTLIPKILLLSYNIYSVYISIKRDYEMYFYLLYLKLLRHSIWKLFKYLISHINGLQYTFNYKLVYKYFFKFKFIVKIILISFLLILYLWSDKIIIFLIQS